MRRLGFQLGAVPRGHQSDCTEGSAHPAHPIVRAVDVGQTVRNIFELLGIMLQVQGDFFHTGLLLASPTKTWFALPDRKLRMERMVKAVVHGSR